MNDIIFLETTPFKTILIIKNNVYSYDVSIWKRVCMIRKDEVYNLDKWFDKDIYSVNLNYFNNISYRCKQILSGYNYTNIYVISNFSIFWFKHQIFLVLYIIIYMYFFYSFFLFTNISKLLFKIKENILSNFYVYFVWERYSTVLLHIILI